MSDDYADIMLLSRPTSQRAPMPVADRAAQFTPFAALTGHDAAIAETGRHTDARIIISDAVKQEISAALAYLMDTRTTHASAHITWFVPDVGKAGGAYVVSTGVLRKLDTVDNVVHLMSGEKIPVADIVSVEVTTPQPPCDVDEAQMNDYNK